MQLQSAFLFLQSSPPSTHFSPPLLRSVNKHIGNQTGLTRKMPAFRVDLKPLVPSLTSNSRKNLGFRVVAKKGSDPFRGKSGSVSFGGLTHQSVEESQLVSAPFKEGTGSLLWVFAPVALISSLVVPQFFIVTAIEDVFKNELLWIIFYVGLAMFLFVTERVQKPYLEFSAKRWSLITGLRGYLSSAFFTMGFKVFAPLIAVYVTWPVLGLPALIAVAPFLVGCLAQFVFERFLDGNCSSCWPLLPIIFEVYRIYQLTRATNFMEKLIYGMQNASVSPAVLDRTGALISMIVTFRVIGVVCLWSLLTFLLRLFPSRPVAENY